MVPWCEHVDSKYFNRSKTARVQFNIRCKPLRKGSYIHHLPFEDFFEFVAAPFLWNLVKPYHSCLLLQAAGAKKAYSIWMNFCVKHFGQSETQMSSIAAINRTNM